MSKVLILPENCISKQNSSDLLHLSRKVDIGAPKHEVSLAPAMKSHHRVRKCARHHNESAVARSTHCRHPDSASRRSRSAHGRCERHECTVNSNELAVHGRAPQRSKHTFVSPTVRTPQWGLLFNIEIRKVISSRLLKAETCSGFSKPGLPTV